MREIIAVNNPKIGTKIRVTRRDVFLPFELLRALDLLVTLAIAILIRTRAEHPLIVSALDYACMARKPTNRETPPQEKMQGTKNQPPLILARKGQA